MNHCINYHGKIDASWTWQSEQEAAFKRIKELVTTPPVLQFCDTTKEATIQRDESSSSLGAVLMQDVHPIVYNSKAQQQKETMHRLRKKVWQLHLDIKKLINIYTWENHRYNTYRSQISRSNIPEGYVDST